MSAPTARLVMTTTRRNGLGLDVVDRVGRSAHHVRGHLRLHLREPALLLVGAVACREQLAELVGDEAVAQREVHASSGMLEGEEERSAVVVDLVAAAGHRARHELERIAHARPAEARRDRYETPFDWRASGQQRQCAL